LQIVVYLLYIRLERPVNYIKWLTDYCYKTGH